MIINYLILFFAFLLEGILSIFIPFSINNLSLFTPLITIASLVILFPYFKENNKNYLWSCVFLGFAFDILYTDTLILNAFVFFLAGLFIKWLYLFLNKNLLNSLFIVLTTITFYQFLSYLILVIVGYLSFNIFSLLYLFVHSYLFNIIYALILYLILSKVYRKKKKKF